MHCLQLVHNPNKIAGRDLVKVTIPFVMSPEVATPEGIVSVCFGRATATTWNSCVYKLNSGLSTCFQQGADGLSITQVYVNLFDESFAA